MSRSSKLANLTALFGLGFFASASPAITLGQYTFESNSVAASSIASGNLNFSDFMAGTGLSIPSTGASAAGNPGSAIIRSRWSADPTYSATNNQNFFFTVTPNNTELDLSNLKFDAQRSNTGPANLFVSSSKDSFASSTPLSLSTAGSFSSFTADLSNLSDITTPITLKISGTGATNTGGTLRVDNVQLNGEVGTITPPAPPTPISIYQASANIGNNVTTSGVVIGNYPGDLSGLGGFFIQDINSNNNPISSGLSNGIFVSAPSASINTLQLGNLVNLAGQVSETVTSGITKYILNLNGTITDLGVSPNSVTPTVVNLPFASADVLQRYQGMLVTLPQTLTVTNNFPLGRFGQVGLSSDGRLYQPTQVATPGSSTAIALATANSLNQIILDDGKNGQNPDPISYPTPVPPGLTAQNTLRLGETTTGVTGIVDSGTFAGNTSYVIQPIPTFTTTFDKAGNPRPITAPDVGGNITVASANVENYFTTLGSRGAQTALEFIRQQAKVVSNLAGLNADVLGLSEVENNGFGSTSAIFSLVNALNDRVGTGTYSYINPGVTAIGTDAITNAIIYKSAKVTPIGNAAILDDTILNRPSFAQTFVGNSGTEQFTIDVNHFKSKGGTATSTPNCSASANSDNGLGIGGFNCSRNEQAKLVRDWLATNPTNSTNSNILIVGDLNSYAKEDPIKTLELAGYINLDQQFAGTSVPYSYQFSGQSGTLDYVLASASINPFVTGGAPWHINADEPAILGFGTAFKSPSQIDSLYSPDAFASSDHDPLLIGLNLPEQPSAAPQAVPEPSSILGLFGLGILGFTQAKRKQK